MKPSNRIYTFSFITLALAQLFFPLQMLVSSELTLAYGKDYKFKTMPVDPNDPFRGKYVQLRFDNSLTNYSNNLYGSENNTAFVTLAEDSLGYAKIKSIDFYKPATPNYIKVDFAFSYDSSSVIIEYPFDRFYMEESKAYPAEVAYRQAARNGSVTYALVTVKSGVGVLKDVLINDRPIAEVAAEVDLDER